MQVHEIKKANPNKRKKKIGRGGARGTYSGKGIKGQKSRAGAKIRPHMRDVIKKIPKKRGYKFASIQVKPLVVNLAQLEQEFKNGDEITPKILVSRGLVNAKKGDTIRVKILGNGTLTKNLTVVGCDVSKTVEEAIKKNGGTITNKERTKK